MRNNEVLVRLLERSELQPTIVGSIPLKRNCHTMAKEEGLDERCHDCGKPLPRGKSLRTWYCQTIGLCRYCYRHKYPTRPVCPLGTGRRNRKQTPVKPNGKRLLSWTERRYLERAGFNEEVWSPEFRAEMHEYYRARMRGEV
jgi:hypothetical protein